MPIELGRLTSPDAVFPAPTSAPTVMSSPKPPSTEIPDADKELIALAERSLRTHLREHEIRYEGNIINALFEENLDGEWAPVGSTTLSPVT